MPTFYFGKFFSNLHETEPKREKILLDISFRCQFGFSNGNFIRMSFQIVIHVSFRDLTCTVAVADLHGKILDASPPPHRSIFVHFYVGFSEIWPNNRSALLPPLPRKSLFRRG